MPSPMPALPAPLPCPLYPQSNAHRAVLDLSGASPSRVALRGAYACVEGPQCTATSLPPLPYASRA